MIYKAVAPIVDPARLQDVIDVEGVFRRMGPQLDTAYLRTWATFWEKEGIQGVVKRIEDLAARWSSTEGDAPDGS